VFGPLTGPGTTNHVPEPTVIASVVAWAAPARAATAVPIVGASGERLFDGVGAISGGGNSRLLIDYA